MTLIYLGHRISIAPLVRLLTIMRRSQRRLTHTASVNHIPTSQIRRSSHTTSGFGPSFWIQLPATQTGTASMDSGEVVRYKLRAWSMTDAIEFWRVALRFVFALSDCPVACLIWMLVCLVCTLVRLAGSVLCVSVLSGLSTEPESARSAGGEDAEFVREGARDDVCSLVSTWKRLCLSALSLSCVSAVSLQETFSKDSRRRWWILVPSGLAARSSTRGRASIRHDVNTSGKYIHTSGNRTRGTLPFNGPLRRGCG